MAEPQGENTAGKQPEQVSNGVTNGQLTSVLDGSTMDVNQHTIPLRPRQDNNNSNQNGNPFSSSTAYHPPTVEADVQTQQNSRVNDDTYPQEANEETREEENCGEITNLPPPLPAKKKKKRKNRKPASKRGLDAPTGFESFFADTPLTPDEYTEEQSLYDQHLPFIDRILTAIGRFGQTRRLVSERRNILHKYLTYGGVAVGANMFKGDQDISEMSKTQIAQILTNASVTEEKRNLDAETSAWAIDFLGCMKGFLSRRAFLLWAFEERTEVDLVTTTLERFMDYLLQHDVCPEYRAEVLETRNFCREVGREIWGIAETTRRLPGDFNMACSTLFGGTYAQNYDGNTWWGPDTADSVFVGLTAEEAHQILHFGVAGAASEGVFKSYLEAVNSEQTLKVVDIREHVGFEVTAIESPTPECKEIFTRHSTHFRPVGRVRAKPWTNPDAPPEDLTPAEWEELAKQHQDGTDGEEYIFFIESIIQSSLQVGMKIEATIRIIDCGIMFFDDVTSMFPTFDTYLPNEAMLHWTKPRAVRGAVDFVEEEEENQGGEFEGSENGEAERGGEGAGVPDESKEAQAEEEFEI